MADETVSKLQLDAAQVIQTLATLTAAMQSYTNSLQANAEASGSFSASGSEVEDTSKNIQAALEKQQQVAKDSAASLQNIFGQGLRSNATLAEIARVNDALRSFQGVVVSTKASPEDVGKVITNLGGQFDGTAAHIQSAAIKVKSAIDSLGATNLSATAKVLVQIGQAADQASAAAARANQQAVAAGAASQLRGSVNVNLSQGTPQQIAAVNSALNTFTNQAAKSGLSAQQLSGIINDLGGSYSGASAQVAASANRFVAATNAINGTPAAINSVAVSFGSLVRIFATQTITRALHDVASGFTDAVDAARKFEISVAEILTISTELRSQGIEPTAQAIGDLSSQFGQPIADVAKGLYETLSNQIGDARESVQFLTTALEFSKGAVTSTANAVDLLSGIQQAYGQTAASAARNSDVLFKTIEVGRVRADDLANTFGRVLPLAATLGVGLEEVGAILATLTLQSISPDEALTQLSNIMLKLIKPSKDLEAALKSLGVESVAAGVAGAGGLQPFLTQLIAKTDGSIEGTTELFNQIRALKGVLGTTGGAADLFASSLNAITTQSDGASKAAANLIQATPAAQLTAELEAAKNVLINDFGIPAVETINNVIKSLGGATNAVQTFIAAGSVLGQGAILAGFAGIGLAITTLITNFGALTLAASTAGAAIITALGPIGIGIAIGAGVGLLVTYINKFQELSDVAGSAQAAVNETQSRQNAQIKAAIAGNQAQIIASKAAVAQQVASAEQLFFQLDQLYNKDLASATAEQKTITTNLQGQLNARLSAVQSLESKLQGIRDKATAAVQKAQQEQLNIEFNAQNQQFQRQLQNATPASQSAALITRSNKVLQAGQDAFSKGNTDFADKLFANALTLAEQAAAVAGKESAGQSQVNKILQQRATLTQQIVDRENEIAQAATDTDTAIKGPATDLKAAADQFSAAEKALASSPKSQEDIDKFAAEAGAAAEKIQTALGQIQVPDIISKNLKFDPTLLTKQFSSALNGQPIQLNLAVEQQAQALRDRLQAVLGQVPLDVKINITDILGVNIDKFGSLREVQSELAKAGTQIQTTIENTTNEVSRLTTQIEGAADNVTIFGNAGSKGFDELIDKAGLLGKTINITANGFSTSLTDQSDPRLAQVQALQAELNQITEQANQAVTGNDASGIAAAQTQVTNFLAALKTASQNTGLNFDPIAATVQKLGSTLQQAADDTANLNKNFEQSIDAKDKIQGIQTIIQGLSTALPRAETAASGLETALKQIGNVGETGGIEAAEGLSEIGAAAEAQIPAVQALIRELEFAGSSGFGESAGGDFALGGRINFLAGGGSPRGTDTIPTMLSPGEFVVNAQDTSRFFPQLVAMNKGQTPVFRENGGTVNTSVGDIVINMHGEKGQTTGRKIADELRRELRRKTSRR